MSYNKKVYTASANLYDSNSSAMELAFFEYKASIKLANVFEEFQGKVAKRGTLMYDYDKAIIIVLNLEEMLQLKTYFNTIVSKKMDNIIFRHKSGESIKEFYSVYSLDSQTECFQIYLADLERDDPDGDPVATAWFNFAETTLTGTKVKFNAGLFVFKEWIDASIRMMLKIEVHANKINNGYVTNFNDNRRGGRRSNYSNNDQEFDDNDTPVRSRPKVLKRTSRPKNKEAGGNDNNNFTKKVVADDIPF